MDEQKALNKRAEERDRRIAVGAKRADDDLTGKKPARAAQRSTEEEALRI